MALTIGAPTSFFSTGARFKTVVPITLDNSYPTGGYPITGFQLGLPAGQIDVCDANVGPLGGYTLKYNPTTGKLQAFRVGAALSTPQGEVANAVDLSAVTGQLVTEGK